MKPATPSVAGNRILVIVTHPTFSLHIGFEGRARCWGVEWQYQKPKAERVARRISGVKGITNLITVKPRVSSVDLKKKIEDALVRNVEVDAGNITVETMGNKAILRVRVRSWAEKEEAGGVAWSAPGMTEVDNQISIAP